jgi:hypothetical protein
LLSTDFSIDSSFETGENAYNKYILNKYCVIFDKEYGEEPLCLYVHKDFELSNYISKISDYINWLGTECKNILINYFNENMRKKADAEWYDALDVYTVMIFIEKDGEIRGEISCGDNYWEPKNMDVEIKDKKINSMEYWEDMDFGDE